MPQFSIIVPVFRQPELLTRCLRSIRASAFEDYELLVSDDGTPEAAVIRRIAEQFGATLIRAEIRKGGAAARNRAARAATGNRLAFFDADVALHPDTMVRLARAFEGNPAPDAVIGADDTALHSGVPQPSQEGIPAFRPECGAISRERFAQLGGFDESCDGASHGDAELGLRLHRAGGRIVWAPGIQVTRRNAVPSAALPRDRAALGLSVLALILFVIALRHAMVWWGLLALDLCAVAICQAPALLSPASAGGSVFAPQRFPRLLISNVMRVVRLCADLVRVEYRHDRWLLAAVLAGASLILTLQIAGGAYRAQFDGDPDEASHFVSGLMVYDYLAAPPAGNPLVWAEQYYLHYPKVGIGHWPPLFYGAEALWWLVFPPSRWSILALEGLVTLVAATLFYRLVRRLGPPWLALSATLLLIATPVLRQSFDMAMADALCLLWSVALADASVRLVKRPSASRLALVGLWLTCAVLTKGTGVCLLPVPAIALLMTGTWRLAPRRWLWGCLAVVLAAGFGWYGIEAVFLKHSLVLWGGVTSAIPWPVGMVPQLAGWGICILAAAGIPVTLGHLRRDRKQHQGAKQPAAVVAAAMLVSAVAVSYALRAMNQPRHWIIVLPALFILSTESLMWISRREVAAAAIALAALALFPWSVFHQSPGAFAAFAGQLRRPARLLVSSTSAGEGALIAEISLSEPRPSSVVVRATKVLASSGWNGENYRLTASSPGEVERRLDELDIGEVALHTDPGETGPPHHRLLLETLRQSRAWRQCGTVGTIAAWCRILAPAVARKPLRIDLSDKIGFVVQEETGSR